MADRSFYPSYNYGYRRVYMEFYFTLNGGSSPLTSTIGGVGGDVVTSLTRTGAGVIDVQLSAREKFYKVIYAGAEMDDTANDGAYATIKSITNEASATAGIKFTITTRAGATTTATDYTARKISVCLVLKNTAASNPS